MNPRVWVNARNAGDATARVYDAPPDVAIDFYAAAFPECMEFDVRIIG